MPPATKCTSTVGCMVRVRIAVAPLTLRISYARESRRRVPYHLVKFALVLW